MNVLTADLQPSLPWTAAAEDRRFRRILMLSLLVFALLAAVITWVPVIRPAVMVDVAPPLRLARIIEQPVALDTPAAGGAKVTVQTRSAASPPPPQAGTPAVRVAPAPVARRPVESKRGPPSPREQAAHSGVLAMSKTLAELTRATPGLGAPAETGGPARREIVSEVVMAERSRLTAGITRGSGGLGGEKAAPYGALLGPSEGLGSALGGAGKSGGGGGALTGTAGPGQPGTGIAGSVGRGTSSGEARSRDEIQEILERNKPAIYKLYNNALRRDPDLQGHVLMSVTIEPGGRVTACRIISSELKAPELEAQLVEFIRRIDFGAKPGVRVVTTRVPIEFFPI